MTIAIEGISVPDSKSPANIVPGIGFSPYKMLQARLVSCGATQRYQLGVNCNRIPEMLRSSMFHSCHRDGIMRTDGNLGRTVTFHPNSSGLWGNRPDFAEPPLSFEGDAAHWTIALRTIIGSSRAKLFRMMTPAQQQTLLDNTARAMGDARPHVKQRHVANCRLADPRYGAGVAEALGLRRCEQPDAALSSEARKTLRQSGD